ncbi:hypothetical protein BDW22DRAFT_1422790 [Trametopsis cervina]|nr:hypothetical protein BDW22DRAFT_1422790 [Trametopsis cervina]
MAHQPPQSDPKIIQNALAPLSNSLDDVDDHEMLRLSQEMNASAPNALLKCTQNHSSMINRLPPEILSTVFEFLMPPYPRIRFPPLERDEMDYDPEPRIPDTTPKYSTLWATLATASLVCRHWREVALATPALWADIPVPPPHGDFIPTQLARSGNYPLNVQFSAPVSPALLDLPLVQNVFKESHRIRRLTVWVQTDSKDIQPWLENATRLETLDIMSRDGQNNNPRSVREFPLLCDSHTPHLETLTLSNWARWPTGPLRTLRYLVLDFEHNISTADLTNGLMAVLAANAHSLEEIVAFGISSFAGGVEIPDLGVSPVDMRALKRLIVGDGELFHRVVEPKLVLHECARDYRFSLSMQHLEGIPLGNSNRFPVTKLFISRSHTAGTNGTSAVRTRNTGRVSLLTSFIEPHDVQELWLSQWTDARCSINPWVPVPPPIAGLLAPMLAVTKLVILRDEQLWLSPLTELDQLFPALRELQLHSQVLASYPTLRDFVARRKEQGRAIQTLRFVRDPHQNCDTAGWAAFEMRKALLEGYVANVVYEDVPDGGKPPRMPLPAVCETDSSVHIFWDAWELD